MKYLIVVFFLLIGTLNSIAQKNTNDSKAGRSVKIVKETSYAYGYSFAKDLTSNENFEDKERVTKYVIQGIKEGLKPDSAKLASIVEVLMKRIDKQKTATTTEVAQKTAYNLGYNALGNLVSLLELEAKDLNYGSIKKGYTDFVKGRSPKVNLEKQRQLLAAFFQEKQALAEQKVAKRRKKRAIENLAKVEAFLAENAKKNSIKTTRTGLQYQVIKEGTGVRPSINNRVRTHYTGTFMDGKVFDSSMERGVPTELNLTTVIKGWQEGICLMRVGGHYRFFVPPILAYGEKGTSTIPANSLLIFDVELLDIVEEKGAETAVKKLSYAYGYTVGTALTNLNFTQEETAVSQFLQGFERGLKSNTATVKAVEERIKARIASKVPSSNTEMAYQIANGIGYTSAVGLVKLSQACSSDFDYQALGEGYEIGLQQKQPLYSVEEMNNVLDIYATSKKNTMEELSQSQTEDKTALARTVEKGKKFLIENSKKEGVITTESGLQYQILNEGTGRKATINSTVTTHYIGQLVDGTIFDSSVERGQPVTFPLKAVIKGWQQGIPLMQEGAKYRFFIPAHLAYGNRSMGDNIPAGSTLIFEVELLKVE